MTGLDIKFETNIIIAYRVPIGLPNFKKADINMIYCDSFESAPTIYVRRSS